jgi:hypothetical protein
MHQYVVARTKFQPPDPSFNCCLHVFFFFRPFPLLPETILIPLLLGLHLHPQHINKLPKMIINPEMLKTTGSLSSVAPIPTVVPGPAITFQKAGDVGNRTLWYAASSSLRSLATDKLAQGCCRHNGSLLAGFLCHGLPCPSCKSGSSCASNQ